MQGQSMTSTIQLRQGDMFAQPTDLIVIPCSTGGTVTKAVAKQLGEFDIQWPRGYSNLGDIKFEFFKGASNIATYVGYATSVEAMTTSIEAIAEIAESVGRFISDKSEIRDVAIPLLGAGAGGLTPEESLKALMSGFEKIQSKGKVVNIFVFNEGDFRKLSSRLESRPERRRGRGAVESRQREPLRVFISYTRTSSEHQDWVRDLAKYLRENGIDARLDVWHLRPGIDLPQWMCNKIDLADRILIVCNEEYASKASDRLGGVGWEIRLIQGDLLQSQSSNPKKYLPILRGHFSEKSVPSFLRGVYALSWGEADSDKIREQLLREIYEVFDEAPSLGQPPRFVLSQ
jgi:TIR domain